MDGKQLKLCDFARECGVTERAIQKHLKKLEGELEGHFERRGANGTWLDETAMSIIRGRMVAPPPPIVSDGNLVRENEELRAALLQMQSRYIELQEKMLSQSELLLEAQQNKVLLQAATKREETLNAEVDAERERAERALEEARTAQERADRVAHELEETLAAFEAEKSRKLTLMERIKGRK